MFGIYVHIPFCLKKCSYCDFFSMPISCNGVPAQKYLSAISKQLDRELSAGSLDGRVVGSVYFGGGTPSLMPPEFFNEVLLLLRQRFIFDVDIEVSSEVNPATVNVDWFRRVREVGMTRISIGVQSFQPRLLTYLGRIHTSDEAMHAIAEAQDAEFKSVSVDLMYAILGETLAELEDDLRTVMTFQPGHISAYQLTIEEGTPLWASQTRQVSEDKELKQMRMVSRMFSRAGWRRHEISNFAKSGHECWHNLNYWRYGEWLGLGAGATSFMRTNQDRAKDLFARRWTQVRDIVSYLDESGGLAEDEFIGNHTAEFEFCFMGLRTMEGISPIKFEKLFKETLDQRYGNIIASLVQDDLLKWDENRLHLTAKGLEVANQVFAQFVS